MHSVIIEFKFFTNLLNSNSYYGRIENSRNICFFRWSFLLIVTVTSSEHEHRNCYTTMTFVAFKLVYQIYLWKMPSIEKYNLLASLPNSLIFIMTYRSFSYLVIAVPNRAVRVGLVRKWLLVLIRMHGLASFTEILPNLPNTIEHVRAKYWSNN